MIDVIVLGVNRVGEQIYEWLLDQENTNVLALITDNSQYDSIEELDPDLLISSGFRHIIPEWVLEIPKEGAINCHLSYLPYNRGMNPNVWSIVEDTPAGVSLHYMTEDVDMGPVIDRRRVEVEPDDTGKTLYHRCEETMFELFVDSWPTIIDDDIDVIEQDPEAGSYHRKERFFELCEINLEEEVIAGEFINRLRALTFPPYDNAFFECDGEKYYLELKIKKKSGDENSEIHWNIPEYDQ